LGSPRKTEQADKQAAVRVSIPVRNDMPDF
jgi:hypothetical protein